MPPEISIPIQGFDDMETSRFCPDFQASFSSPEQIIELRCTKTSDDSVMPCKVLKYRNILIARFDRYRCNFRGLIVADFKKNVTPSPKEVPRIARYRSVCRKSIGPAIEGEHGIMLADADIKRRNIHASDIGRIAHKKIEIAGNRGMAVTRHREKPLADPISTCIRAGRKQCALAQIRPDGYGPGQFVKQAYRDRTAAGTDIEDRQFRRTVPTTLKHLFHEQFGVGPWLQRFIRQGECQAPEFFPPKDSRNGFARQPVVRQAQSAFAHSFADRLFAFENDFVRFAVRRVSRENPGVKIRR
nr:hypothetical protein [Stappia sediminis]